MISKNKIKEVLVELIIELKEKRQKEDIETMLELIMYNEDMIFMHKLLEKLNIN